MLVTGGARSGKSRFAEAQALRHEGTPVYIATAEARDGEMADRISLHKARRGDQWRLTEEPRDLAAALQATDGTGPRLVDCLTLWLSNLMLDGQDWQEETEVLAGVIRQQRSPVIFVTNEVGAGIVPENALARAYRDAAGTMNQRVAEAVDEVWLVVSGCPLRVKPGPE